MRRILSTTLIVVTVSLTAFLFLAGDTEAALEFSFLQNTQDTSDLTTYTFASQNLGAADADRYVIVGVIGRKAGSSACSISSVTVGGVTATELLDQGSTDANCDVAGLYIANVPSGSSGDVVVTFPNQMVRAAIGLWRAVNIDSPTPTDASASVASDPTYAIDAEAGGFAVGMCISNSQSSATWTGLTERFDETMETFVTYTGADMEFASQQTNTTLTCDFASSGSTPVGVFASWAEAVAPTGPLKGPQLRLDNGGVRLNSAKMNID